MASQPPERAAVLAAYAALPDSHRAVLDLSRAGHTFDAIARSAGVPVALVRRWALHATCALSQARLAAAQSELPAGT
ncbi:MAG: hypothetical protein JWO12_1801 [Frankiales bacterium]|nr:hypothetical protein [Frankiales bacterium]